MIAGDISAPLNGGNGGYGGGFLDGGYGGGGAGGDGVRNEEVNPAIFVTADVHGGDGGDGNGNGPFAGGGGGGGGAGMVLLNNGAITVESSATVAGGNGGNPGANFGGGGGAGIVLNAGGDLTNHGDVLGGTGGALATGGTAIVMGDLAASSTTVALPVAAPGFLHPPVQRSTSEMVGRFLTAE
nr:MULTISPECIES: hypothetical protein [unclassified Mesorhizobium]